MDVKTPISYLRNGPLRSFTSQPFCMFWIASFISQVSFSMMLLTRGWLILDMTNSPFLVTTVNAIAFIPGSLASPFTGVIADRFDRKKILLVGETATFLTLLILAIIEIQNLTQVWHVFFLTTLNGIAFGLIMPTRPSLVPNLVGEKNVVNGMALYTMLISASLLFGPMLAGYVIDSFSIGIALLIGSLILIPGFIFLLMLNIPPRENNPNRTENKSFVKDLSEGATYVLANPSMIGLLLIALIASAFATPYLTLLPVIARDVFNTGPNGLGMLGSGAGAGSLIGALMLAFLSNAKRIRRFLIIGAVAMGPILTLFALSPILILGVITIFFVGIIIQITLTSNITLVQMESHDYMRGRIMGIRYVLMTSGPVGMLLLGITAELFGAPIALLLMSFMALLFAVLVIARFPKMRLQKEQTVKS
jgi:MFS family permease